MRKRCVTGLRRLLPLLRSVCVPCCVPLEEAGECGMNQRWFRAMESALEAPSGIEPEYTDLQSVA